MKKAILLLLLSLCVIPNQSCRDKDDTIVPYVAVDFSIDILSTFYTELSAVGGWVNVTGGYKGILIYRLSTEEFVAFDRCCTYKPKEPCERIQMESSGLSMIDSCCGSRFIVIDGSVLEGPAQRALRQYSTSFDGRYLRVYN